jgi:hypothetical protein
MATRCYGNEAIDSTRTRELDAIILRDREGNWRWAGLVRGSRPRVAVPGAASSTPGGFVAPAHPAHDTAWAPRAPVARDLNP